VFSSWIIKLSVWTLRTRDTGHVTFLAIFIGGFLFPFKFILTEFLKNYSKP
jgi:hypothetical protein